MTDYTRNLAHTTTVKINALVRALYDEQGMDPEIQVTADLLRTVASQLAEITRRKGNDLVGCQTTIR